MIEEEKIEVQGKENSEKIEEKVDTEPQDNVQKEEVKAEVVDEESKKEEPKKKSGLKKIGQGAFWAFVTIIVLICLASGIDKMSGYNFPLFGFRTSVVVSPSMEIANPENDYLDETMKRIKKNDVITTQNISYENIKLYDVITYVSSNGLICHRVIAKYENENGKYLVTRGDANNVDDAPINYSLVRGKVVLVTPGVGGFVSFIQSPYFIIGFFGSAFFIFLGFYIFKNGKNKKEEKVVSTRTIEENDKQIESQEVPPEQENLGEEPQDAAVEEVASEEHLSTSDALEETVEESAGESEVVEETTSEEKPQEISGGPEKLE